MHAASRTKWNRRVKLVIAVTIVAVLIAALLPLLWKAQDAARRSESRNNLKQIGLGLLNYHDAYLELPPGTVVAADGHVQRSWMVPVIPQLGDNTFYGRVDLRLPWDHPRNAPEFQWIIPVFLVPGVAEKTDSNGFGLSHYAGSGQLFAPNRSSKLDKLPQGASNTILGGEVGEDYRPWGGGLNVRDPSAPLNSGPNSFGRYTGDGAHILMADASVRFVANPDGRTHAKRRQRSSNNPIYTWDDREVRPGLTARVQLDQDGHIVTVVAHPTDADLDFVERMPDLKYLVAWDKSLTDAALERVSLVTRLEVLRMRGSFTAAGLKHLQQLKNLRFLELTVNDPTVLEPGLAPLKDALPGCDCRIQRADRVDY